jgi:hypothetical protein
MSQRRAIRFACLLALPFWVGCLSDVEIFTQGRLEKVCNGVVPVCQVQAGCVLDGEEFVRGEFPGDQRLLIRSEKIDQVLVARILMTEMVYPGTELLIQAFDPGCADLSEEHLVDVDLFEFAGDDRIFEFHLDLPESGDHLVEVFSDMSAAYLLTFTVEDDLR